MKKVITLFLTVVFVFLFIMSTTVFAVDVATLKAQADKSIIKAGEELKVSLSLVDINEEELTSVKGISTKIEYDTNIFEEISANDITTDYLKVFDENDPNHEFKIASADGISLDEAIATITLRAKTNIVSTETTIKFKETKIGDKAIADTTLTVKIGAEEIPAVNDVTLSKIEITKKPTKQAYRIGEKFDPAGMEVTATYSDDTKKVVTGYTFQPTDELKETDNKITITYKEGTITKTAEQKIYVNETGALPYTGIENYVIIAILVICAVSGISLLKAKKYNNV